MAKYKSLIRLIPRQIHWKTRRGIRRTIFHSAGIFFASALSFISLSFGYTSNIKTRAANTNETKDNIIAAVHELEGVMKDSYEKTREDVARLSEEGYDYELTMESMDDLGLPYSDYDYEGFIAAYSTAQGWILDNGGDLGGGVNDIKFLTYDYEPVEITEYIPEEETSYEDLGDGTYKKSGMYYINEPCDLPVYKETEEGIFIKDGTRRAELEKKNVKYAQISLKTVTPEEIYTTFGLNREDFIEEESRCLERIQEVMGEADLKQSVFLAKMGGATQDDIAKITKAVSLAGDNEDSQRLISTAATLIGRVPYEWGGKSSRAGFDNTWYTFDSTGRQKGLDCSGFVQWVFRTCGIPGWEDMISTSTILSSEAFIPVTSDQLKPGDLGLFYSDSRGHTNHVGIYLGEGNWIHCSSSRNTVAVTSGDRFVIYRHYRGLNGDKKEIPEEMDIDDAAVPDRSKTSVKEPDDIPEDEEPTEDKADEDDKEESEDNDTVEASSADVINTEACLQPVTSAPDEMVLMAKIVMKEAYSEGYNGWVGVAQVIRNRVLSGAFPSTIAGVVSAPRQFTTYSAAASMSDSDVDPAVLDVCRHVMDGSLAVFDSNNVIAFKRAQAGDETWGRWHKYTSIGNHSFYTN